MKRRTSKRAIALFTIIAIISIVAALTVIVGTAAIFYLRTTQEVDLKKRARYAAYGGTQWALCQIRKHPTWTDTDWAANLNGGLNSGAMPNDSASNYTVNITSNLAPASPTSIIYAPDGTPVLPNLVYVQSVGRSQGLVLQAGATLATVGLTGNVRWDRAARVTDLLNSTSSIVDSINNATGIAIPPPAPPQLLVSAVQNSTQSVVLGGNSYVDDGIELPSNSTVAQAIQNTTTGPNPAYLSTSVGANPTAVPWAGVDTSLDTTTYSSANAPPFVAGTSYVSTAVGGGTLTMGGAYLFQGLTLTSVNLTTPTNTAIYVDGDITLTNCYINWKTATSIPSAATCQIYCVHNHGAHPPLVTLNNVTGSFVFLGGTAIVNVTGGQWVGSMMADSLTLTGARLDYDPHLLAQPVLAPLEVKKTGQKWDGQVRSGIELQ